MTRQEANLKIIDILTKLIVEYPEARFCQLLSNLNVTHKQTVSDESAQEWIEEILSFYEEPGVTLTRVRAAAKKLKRKVK